MMIINVSMYNSTSLVYSNFIGQQNKKNTKYVKKNYSRLSLSRSQRDHLKDFKISVLRHIRFAELRKIPIEPPNFTDEHVF